MKLPLFMRPPKAETIVRAPFCNAVRRSRSLLDGSRLAPIKTRQIMIVCFTYRLLIAAKYTNLEVGFPGWEKGFMSHVVLKF